MYNCTSLEVGDPGEVPGGYNFGKDFELGGGVEVSQVEIE
jgi:hypothetical protein